MAWVGGRWEVCRFTDVLISDIQLPRRVLARRAAGLIEVATGLIGGAGGRPVMAPWVVLLGPGMMSFLGGAGRGLPPGEGHLLLGAEEGFLLP